MLFILFNLPLVLSFFFFFFNDTATTEIYTLSLHDALPISSRRSTCCSCIARRRRSSTCRRSSTSSTRSEEHTSELQSPVHLVCRLLLEKKKTIKSAQQNLTDSKHTCASTRYSSPPPQLRLR